MYNRKPLLGTLPNYAYPLTPNVGAWVMNENSGNKVFDLIGKNHGTLENGASWDINKIKFDGNNDKIDCGSKTKLNLTKFTIVMEFKADTLAQYDALFSKGLSDLTTEYNYLVFMTNATTPQLIWKTAGGSESINCSTISTDTTYQIACGIDGTRKKFYLNGVEVANEAQTSSPVTNANPLRIGNAWVSTGYGLDGIISYAFLYDYLLTKSQIAQLYINPYCWLAQPMEVELMYAAPPIGLPIPIAMHHYETLRA